MSDKEKISIRLKKDLIDDVKEIMDLKGTHGANSKAIRKALRFYKENWKQPIDDFRMRYGTQQQNIIKNYLEDDDN